MNGLHKYSHAHSGVEINKSLYEIGGDCRFSKSAVSTHSMFVTLFIFVNVTF